MSLPIQTIEITDEVRWGLLQKKTQEAKALRAFSLFRSAGIEPVLIKGIAAAANYPPEVTRRSVDIDLAVSAADHKKGLAIVRENVSSGLAIDLHCELRHLDAVPWEDLFEHSLLLAVDDGEIRILRPEDHLRVMCVHWLTDGGSSRDRLWDIYYAVANRKEDFDWARFLNIVEPHRRRWLLCTLGLAHKYLGLDLKDTPAENAADDLPQWLVHTVESEWNTDTPQRPLETTIRDPRMMIRQIGKRLRPNPIWATVQLNGSFDAPTRVHYQIANLFKRIVPSYRRIRDTIKAGG